MFRSSRAYSIYTISGEQVPAGQLVPGIDVNLPDVAQCETENTTLYLRLVSIDLHTSSCLTCRFWNRLALGLAPA